MTTEVKPTQDAQAEAKRFLELLAELEAHPLIGKFEPLVDYVHEACRDLVQKDAKRSVDADALRFNKSRIAAVLVKEKEAKQVNRHDLDALKLGYSPAHACQIAEHATRTGTPVPSFADLLARSKPASGPSDPPKTIKDKPLADAIAQRDALNLMIEDAFVENMGESAFLLLWLVKFLAPSVPSANFIKEEWMAVYSIFERDTGSLEDLYLLERLRELKQAVTQRSHTESPDEMAALRAESERLENSPCVNDLETIPGDEVNFISKDGHHIAHIDFVEDSGVHSLKLTVWSVDGGDRLALTYFDYDTAPQTSDNETTEPSVHAPYKPEDEIEARLAAVLDVPLPGKIAEMVDGVILAYQQIRDGKPVSDDEPLTDTQESN